MKCCCKCHDIADAAHDLHRAIEEATQIVDVGRAGRGKYRGKAENDWVVPQRPEERGSRDPHARPASDGTPRTEAPVDLSTDKSVDNEREKGHLNPGWQAPSCQDPADPCNGEAFEGLALVSKQYHRMLIQTMI